MTSIKQINIRYYVLFKEIKKILFEKYEINFQKV